MHMFLLLVLCVTNERHNTNYIIDSDVFEYMPFFILRILHSYVGSLYFRGQGRVIPRRGDPITGHNHAHTLTHYGQFRDACQPTTHLWTWRESQSTSESLHTYRAQADIKPPNPRGARPTRLYTEIKYPSVSVM